MVMGGSLGHAAVVLHKWKVLWQSVSFGIIIFMEAQGRHTTAAGITVDAAVHAGIGIGRLLVVLWHTTGIGWNVCWGGRSLVGGELVWPRGGVGIHRGRVLRSTNKVLRWLIGCRGSKGDTRLQWLLMLGSLLWLILVLFGGHVV